MFKNFLFWIFFFVHNIFALDLETPPPNNSWEAWLSKLRAGEYLSRPDKKNLSDALPLWVDCHLSWASDLPPEQSGMKQLPRQIVLRSARKDCVGQLEEHYERQTSL